MLPGRSLAITPVTELEKYKYADLALISTNPEKDTACFAAPGGKILLARRKSFLGQEFGKIEEIHKDYIVVVELLQINWGEWMERKFRWSVIDAGTTSDLPQLRERCVEKMGSAR